MELITWKENNEKGRNSLKNKNQCSKMAKQRCERRNKKEEIKVTSKYLYGLG